MKFLILLFFLIASLSKSLATMPDPRAVSLIKERGIEQADKQGYRREDTAYSIVIYGAHDSVGIYRVVGVEHGMKINELTKLLKKFYSSFPKDATTSDKRIRGSVPIPNILYASGGWNELKQDGRDLVTELSKEHGIALYYFTNTPGYESSFKALEGIPSYTVVCIDYYQKRIDDIVALMTNNKPALGHSQGVSTEKLVQESKKMVQDYEVWLAEKPRKVGIQFIETKELPKEIRGFGFKSAIVEADLVILISTDQEAKNIEGVSVSMNNRDSSLLLTSLGWEVSGSDHPSIKYLKRTKAPKSIDDTAGIIVE